MAQSVESYYVAPIALTENLIEGATVSGTINGVQVSGTVGAGHVVLYAIAQVLPYQSSGGSLKVADIGDAGNYQIALEKQPESDLTIHLTQTVPAHKVIIPEEYLELTETNQAISTAMSAASTAQSAASSAQTAANAAKTTANTAKTTADTALSTADTAKTTADTAKATANNAKTTADRLANNLTSILNPTTSNSGKFLTVGTNGKPTWTSISNAEGGSY